MGKVKSFTLLLQDNKSVFYPGEAVKGTCELLIKDAVKISLISIELTGLGKVFWTETRASGTRLGPVTENFRSEVEYVRAKQELPFVTERSENDVAEKKHVYSFAFTLPLNLVTSFEGKFGYIRYFLKAELVRPWPRAISVKKYITVIKPIDTNSLQYQRSIAATDENEICCFCCHSGSVHVTAQTDRVAYCPGESVAITARFYNNSIRTVKPYAVLCQTQKFHAKGLTQTVTYRLAMLTGLPLKGRQSAVWDSQLVRLPPVSPSILNSSLIEVHYCIKVGLVVPYCRDVRVTLPIVVGTVPFRYPRLPATLSTTTPVSGISVPPPAYNTLAMPRVSSQQDTTSSSEFSISDPPPAYVESILAGGYLIDDDNDQYSGSDEEVDADEDDTGGICLASTSLDSSYGTRNNRNELLAVPTQLSVKLGSNDFHDRSGGLCRTELFGGDDSSTVRWWRRMGDVSQPGSSENTLGEEQSRSQYHSNRMRNILCMPSPSNIVASQVVNNEAGPSHSNRDIALPSANRRFSPLCPYVAYPPPPSYTEVMCTVSEIIP